MNNDREIVSRLLDVIEFDIVPLTEAGVAKGNKTVRCGDIEKIRSVPRFGGDKQRTGQSALAW